MSGKNEDKTTEKSKGGVKFGTVVTRCKNPKCANRFQDEMYGFGLRVHNRVGKSGTPAARCTACETVKEL